MRITKTIVWVLGLFLSGLLMVGCSISVKNSSTHEAPEEVKVNLGRVAYIQKGNLWVKELPDNKPKQITNGGIASNPHWSQSGNWLLFQKKDQLWLTGSDGSNCELVADKVNAFAWSSTNDVFYYGSAKKGLVSVQPETGESWVLLGPTPGETYGRMVNSPDGRYIAFEKFYEKPTIQSIWKLDISNIKSRTISKLQPIFEGQSPTQNSLGMMPHLAGWSADGKNIYMWVGTQSASLTADGVSFITADAFSGKKLLTNIPGLAGLVHNSWFAPGPDPSSFALIIGSGRESWVYKQLALVNVRTNKLKIVSEKDQAVTSLAFSPSGDSLAYSAAPEEKAMYSDKNEDYSAKSREVMLQRRIWVVKTNGDRPKQLTNDNNYRDENPVWTEKGDYILFGRIDKQDKASLWLMGSDGSHPRLVVDGLSLEDYFGFYGYIEWERVFDYWQG